MGGFRRSGVRRVGGYRYPVRWPLFGMWARRMGAGLWGMGCLLPLVGGVVVFVLALLRLVVR